MLKKKVTKEEFSELNDALKEYYSDSGDGFYSISLDDSDDDAVSALKKAKAHEVEKRKDLEQQVKKLYSKIADMDNDLSAKEYENKKKEGDIAAIEKRWQDKTEKEIAAYKQKLEAKTKFIESEMIESAAKKLSAELLDKSPMVMYPHVKAKLKVEYDANETPSLVVLGDDGQPSSMNLEDLKKNFIASPDFKGIITISKATGSGAPDQVVKSKAVPNGVDLNNMSDADLVELANSNPDAFEQLIKK